MTCRPRPSRAAHHYTFGALTRPHLRPVLICRAHNQAAARQFHSMPKPLPLSSEELDALAEQHGTPLQLYDEAGIRSQTRGMIDAFRASFPGFREFFAVKALPNPAVLKLLLAEGCGLDCSSTSELHIARELGVTGESIMYTSNYTSVDDLGWAYDQGAVINLDDISLVASLVEARGKCSDLISFRLNPGLGRTDSETASNVLGGPDAKFGVPPDQIVEGCVLCQCARSRHDTRTFLVFYYYSNLLTHD